MSRTAVYDELLADFWDGKINFRYDAEKVAQRYDTSVDAAERALTMLAAEVAHRLAPQVGALFGRDFFKDLGTRMKKAPKGYQEAVRREVYGQYRLLLDEGDIDRLTKHHDFFSSSIFLADMILGRTNGYEEKLGERLLGNVQFFVQGFARAPVFKDVGQYFGSRKLRRIKPDPEPNTGLIAHPGNPPGTEKEMDDISTVDKFESFMDSLAMRERESSNLSRSPFQHLY